MNRNMRRHGFWIVGLAFFGVVYGLFLLVSYPQWNKYRRLHLSGRQIMGTVVDKEPARHRRIHYIYEVGPRRFAGVIDADPARLPFDQIGKGDHLPVTYLPDEPSTSVVGEAATLDLSWSALLFGLAPSICLLLAIPLAVAIWQITRRTKAS